MDFPTFMGKIKQPKGEKGSLKWIQQVVNDCPDVLNKPINGFIGSSKKHTIEWLSPKAEDDYSEYRDQAFLDLLGIKLTKTKLNDFWPQRGPLCIQLISVGHWICLFEFDAQAKV